MPSNNPCSACRRRDQARGRPRGWARFSRLVDPRGRGIGGGGAVDAAGSGARTKLLVRTPHGADQLRAGSRPELRLASRQALGARLSGKQCERFAVVAEHPPRLAAPSTGGRLMATGIVKWFSNDKGYGFITARRRRQGPVRPPHRDHRKRLQVARGGREGRIRGGARPEGPERCQRAHDLSSDRSPESRADRSSAARRRGQRGCDHCRAQIRRRDRP
jgi:hypothetical protein